jgi:hypothetical protein
MSVPKSARVKNSCTAGPRWLANGNALAMYGKRFTANKAGSVGLHPDTKKKGTPRASPPQTTQSYSCFAVCFEPEID